MHRKNGKGGRWEFDRDVKDYSNKNVWVTPGYSYILNIYVGSEKPIVDSMTEEVLNQYKAKGFEVSICPVQAPASAVVVWMAMVDARLFHKALYTKLLQHHPRFEKFPIAAEVIPFRLTTHSKALKLKDPKAIVIVIKTARDKTIMAKVVTQCKAMFNKHNIEHTKQCPGFVNLSFIPWIADSDNPAATHQRQAIVMKVLKVHVQQMKSMKLSPLQGVTDIHQYIESR